MLENYSSGIKWIDLDDEDWENWFAIKEDYVNSIFYITSCNYFCETNVNITNNKFFSILNSMVDWD